ncbi:dihydrofolate reductase family protein [Mesorhizobium sp. WSM2239]|uniref:Dihydrofolate reductase family protein n=2 Tax=unclassified Mesorhizobium TaxID=325217 RepID=A0AAU8D778_9HYPH
MTKVVLSFSMSLDGFVAGPDVGIDEPMGRGGERLHDWLFKSSSEIDAEKARDISQRVGATIIGRRTFDVGIGPWEDAPYPVPSFVLTHEERQPLAMKSGTFIFVSDGVESALRKAREAAGDKDIVVMGADIARQYLAAGLADEIVIQLVPVLLGAGTRLFDRLNDGTIELEQTGAVQSPSVTHLRYAIRRNSEQ